MGPKQKKTQNLNNYCENEALKQFKLYNSLFLRVKTMKICSIISRILFKTILSIMSQMNLEALQLWGKIIEDWITIKKNELNQRTINQIRIFFRDLYMILVDASLVKRIKNNTDEKVRFVIIKYLVQNYMERTEDIIASQSRNRGVQQQQYVPNVPIEN